VPNGAIGTGGTAFYKSCCHCSQNQIPTEWAVVSVCVISLITIPVVVKMKRNSVTLLHLDS